MNRLSHEVVRGLKDLEGNRGLGNMAVTGQYLRETDKAVQFKVEEVNGLSLDEPKTFWFPLSQIKSLTHAAPDSLAADTVKVAEWILKNKELL